MEDNTKGFDSKKEFDAIADSETANLKITLLEKHLMESREAALELKRQELELRDKQLAIIAQMQNAVEPFICGLLGTLSACLITRGKRKHGHPFFQTGNELGIPA